MIPSLILSALSLAIGTSDLRRVKEVCDRYEARLHQTASGYYESDVEIGSDGCDAINAVDLAWDAYVSRLAGEIDRALRCEAAVDRILARHGV
jgi:hypothetical protein